ncbi:hypothetical protein KDD17_15990 [Sulfitobacter albidus]|uniref:Succinate dehydrogenase n=1 Tax=Sulfitobacter albidus TaxID=2829501 RepID=A0A975PML6_9RHOB|nr:hypothetical protein [Sulfitobacter albidus]QUJ76370.1 hypothetical protein KDD17_15990 [Sulfitobacter albidus]
MTTWISRVAALVLCGALAGCDALPDASGVLSGIAGDQAPPLTQAKMMRGAVTLVPPTGFCIDPKTLNESFALMARCDTLGATTGSRGAPLGLMSVSFTRTGADAPLPTPQDIASATGTSAPNGCATAAIT